MKAFNQWANECFSGARTEHMVAMSPTVERFERQADGSNAVHFRAPSWMKGDLASVGQAWILAGFAAQGVKVYAPSLAEAESLGQIDINISCDLYRQPFECFAVALPAGLFPDEISGAHGRVFAIIGRFIRSHGHALLALNTLGDGPQDMRGDYVWCDDEKGTVESHIAGLKHAAFTTPERAALDRCRRLYMNACLLLTHYGAKKIGAANPDYERRLLESLGKKKLPPNVRAANERHLKAMPVVYGFDQHVRIYESDTAGDSCGAGGWSVRPHWRRGHWAQQAHGPAGSLRKLVFRPAVMVNAERFAGDAANTRAVYTTANTNAGAA